MTRRTRPNCAVVALALLAAACSTPGAAGPTPAAAEPAPLPAAPAAATTTVPEPPPLPSTPAVRPPFAGGDRDGLDFGTPEAPVDLSSFAEYRVRTDPLPGTLALTFDDGPDPEWTPIILDILKEKGVTATFFVLGWKVDAYPDLARRIVEEGHSLQSHSYRHYNLAVRPAPFVAGQIEETARAIRDATGTTPLCLRPPAGLSNPGVAATAAEHDHQVIRWTAGGDSGDYVHGSRSGVLSRAQTWQAGYVTLMHETWGWLYRDILETMIDELRDRGIGFSTICVLEEVPATPRTW